MKKTLISLVAFLGLGAAFAQTPLTQTTLGSAVSSTSQQTIQLASVTGVIAPTGGAQGSDIFIDGEIMVVQSVSGNYVKVIRGQVGTKGRLHVAGAGVLIGPPIAFVTYGPMFGEGCAVNSGPFAYAPVVASIGGLQWLCSSLTGTVVPGFGNSAAYPGVTAAVASAAGLITPSGPLFHVTGTAAITGFNIPVGFNPKGGGGFCVIPDAAFTTTTANNISKATTAVVGQTLCFTYDPSASKFVPSY
jgi:hypothetical protein